MLIPILLLVALLSLNNARRARIAGLNPMSWIFYTVVAFFTGLFLATFILAIIMMVRNPQLLELAQLNDRVRMNEIMIAYFTGNYLIYTSLMLAGGFGGYLLVRYILERKSPPAP